MRATELFRRIADFFLCRGVADALQRHNQAATRLDAAVKEMLER